MAAGRGPPAGTPGLREGSIWGALTAPATISVIKEVFSPFFCVKSYTFSAASSYETINKTQTNPETSLLL